MSIWAQNLKLNMKTQIFKLVSIFARGLGGGVKKFGYSLDMTSVLMGGKLCFTIKVVSSKETVVLRR